MVTVKAVIVGLATLMVCVTGLKADILTETLTGTVLSTGTSPDNAGAFGGGSLVGDTMKITFMFNLSQFISDGALDVFVPASSETLSNIDTTNAVLTHTLVDTTKSKTFNETNLTAGTNGQVIFEISAISNSATIDPGGTLLYSLIGGLGSGITVYSTAKFPGQVLTGQGSSGAQTFLDQLAEDATYITIGIDTAAGQTDIALDATPPMTQTPEPASVCLLIVVLLVCGYMMKTRNVRRSL
jgi:hypothetical protein